ncbi:hypothetical protein I5535_05815 [Rhodobacteraceae bacterium F11138]|nr:hypothetical protein [Rhodobacteraceae bacterium F11138]
MKGDARLDPKGLIGDAYQIDGITAPECRSIFLDWALSLPEGQETHQALRALLQRYGATDPQHPMSEVMRDGLTSVATPQRRGGWRTRPRN